jgi:hypothetical protein
VFFYKTAQLKVENLAQTALNFFPPRITRSPSFFTCDGVVKIKLVFDPTNVSQDSLIFLSEDRSQPIRYPTLVIS